jgi:hypothetical protein
MDTVISCVMLLWLANVSLGPNVSFDTGAYHVPAVMWMSEYPLVPGLANLLPHLGFNSSCWLYFAALDVGPWEGRASHIGASTLVVMSLAVLMPGFFRLARRASERPVVDGFGAFLVVPILHMSLSDHMTNFMTDLPVMLFAFVTTFFLLRLIADPPKESRDNRFLMFALAGMTCALVTIKLSSVVLAVVTWSVAFFIWWRAAQEKGWSKVRHALVMVGFSTFLISVWMIRGVIISGRPLFPSGLLALNVEWLTPEAVTKPIMAWVTQYARDLEIPPQRLVLDGPWLKTWLLGLWRPDPIRGVYPILLAGTFGLAVIVAAAMNGVRKPGRFAWIFCGPVAALMFWFVTAPSPRFGMFALWIVAAVMFGLLVVVLSARVTPSRQRWIAALIVLMQVPSIAAHTLRQSAMKRPSPADFVRAMLVAPGPDGGFHPIPPVKAAVFTTDSGLRINFDDEQLIVYALPLPSSTYPAPNIRLRVPGDIRAGFVLDGNRWNPVSFPLSTYDFITPFWEHEKALGRWTPEAP